MGPPKKRNLKKTRYFWYLASFWNKLCALTSRRCAAAIACEMWRSWATQYKSSCA